jgi:SAM-dependent methyltransferase
MSETTNELRQIYEKRFAETSVYRNKVWKILISNYFKKWIAKSDVVLDLGCGYGEFINNVNVARRMAMDLNPDSPAKLDKTVEFLNQDCSEVWRIPDETLDLVFTSNFFEHLPDKNCLKKTLHEALRCLKPGGRLIAMGPNTKYLSGTYWDFFDHHTMLTEASLSEALNLTGFTVEKAVPRFLPYTLVNSPKYPLFLLKFYLSVRSLWWIKGKQFLVVAVKK